MSSNVHSLRVSDPDPTDRLVIYAQCLIDKGHISPMSVKLFEMKLSDVIDSIPGDGALNLFISVEKGK